MPVFDCQCVCGAVTEQYVHHYADSVPCETCGRPDTMKLAGRFAVPFSGSLHKYMDPTKEGSDRDGFWAVRTKSSISGNAESVFLDSIQAVREFNKAEGLSAPGDMPTNATISSDGKQVKSTGMPGQWQSGLNLDLLPSAVWRMNKSMTSLTGNAPAPVASGPPCTVQAVDASLMNTFAAEAGSAG